MMKAMEWCELKCIAADVAVILGTFFLMGRLRLA